MGNINVRRIPDEVHRAIKARAKANDRSTEEEVRTILAEAVLPEDQAGAGDLLWSIWAGLDIPDDTFERDKTPYQPIILE
jgi:plasmid stability protein